MHNEGKITMKQGKIVCPSTELDLGVTLTGGQSFRWVACDDGYRGVFSGCVWTLSQDETHLFYTIHEALGKVQGVRILNQDVVENVFSFICSSNNNITRISNMVEKLCLLFGKKICLLDGQDYYAFPSIKSLADERIESKLKEEKFGYRAKYIVNAAKCLLERGGKEWLLNLHKEKNVSYATAREQLITLPGIGPKVADCICLMSLGYLEATPVDTHIFQIVRANYLPHLAKQKSVTPKIHEEISEHLQELWGPLAGWAQAIVFCAKINNSVSVQNQKRKNILATNTATTKVFKKR
ncbi:hypothetical protein KM043_010419 [Ampulex compressa]|nr:hypothetical protein KM043_010419 [Ampulex compressa]